jgi:hypothetical protein
MPNTKSRDKQNVTIRLDKEAIRKVRIVAARRSTSISGLLAQQVEVLPFKNSFRRAGSA